MIIIGVVDSNGMEKICSDLLPINTFHSSQTGALRTPESQASATVAPLLPIFAAQAQHGEDMNRQLFEEMAKLGVSKNGLHGPNLLPRIWASSADTSLPPHSIFWDIDRIFSIVP
ncbi:MAG: hypothetical protein HQL87_17305, partial [Magnetococcales bacterium]|nr:hypothetical protein [Magnetococcales bacterium]